MPNLSGKVAIITGSSSGIGAATAIHFASLGCFVAINGRKIEKLAHVEAECLKAGLRQGQVLLAAGDLTRDEDVVSVVEKTVAHFGKLDILVNNHGIIKVSDMLTAPISDYDDVMNTNMRSVLRMTQLCLPHLKKTKGSIVNVSSVVSATCAPVIGAYSLTKAALDHFTRTSALQLGPSGVRVNSVNPGYVHSDLYVNIGLKDDDEANIWKTAGPKHALGRVGNPDEVAQPIAFLASSEASFITGATLLVDGGFSLMRPT